MFPLNIVICKGVVVIKGHYQGSCSLPNQKTLITDCYSVSKEGENPSIETDLQINRVTIPEYENVFLTLLLAVIP